MKLHLLHSHRATSFMTCLVSASILSLIYNRVSSKACSWFICNLPDWFFPDDLFRRVDLRLLLLDSYERLWLFYPFMFLLLFGLVFRTDFLSLMRKTRVFANRKLGFAVGNNSRRERILRWIFIAVVFYLVSNLSYGPVWW